MENNKELLRSGDIHSVYAFILNEEVMNIVVCDNYTVANDIAKGSYGNTAFAVECTRWMCKIGGKYIDGVFYEPDGVTRCEYIPTDFELAQEAKQEADLANGRINELLVMLNEAKIPLVFDVQGKNVWYYGRMYMLNNNDIALIPDIGNLRNAVIGS